MIVDEVKIEDEFPNEIKKTKKWKKKTYVQRVRERMEKFKEEWEMEDKNLKTCNKNRTLGMLLLTLWVLEID